MSTDRPFSHTAYLDDIYNRSDHASVTMNFAANHIKKGHMFKVIVNLTIDADATETIVIDTGSRPVSLVNQYVNSRALDVNVSMNEGSSYSSVAGEVIPVNVNRYSDDLAETRVYGDVTGISGGEEIDSAFLISAEGRGNRINPASDNNILGWVLKDNTTYDFRLTNNNGSQVLVKYEFEFYENGLDHVLDELDPLT